MTPYYYGDAQSSRILIQIVNEYEFKNIEEELSLIHSMVPEKAFRFIAVKAEDWNRDLSPWPAPPVFGKEAFGGEADRNVSYLCGELLPSLQKAGKEQQQKIYLGGYSLAGLFSLWAAYRSERFSGVAAVSPSVWFPGFTDFAAGNRILTDAVYLSLGDREEKTKNPVMAKVGDAIREIYAGYCSRQTESVLEWNAGNHFREPALRMAKGFAWLLNNDNKKKKEQEHENCGNI